MDTTPRTPAEKATADDKASLSEKESQARALAEKILFEERAKPMMRISPCDEDDGKAPKANPAKVKALKKLYGF